MAYLLNDLDHACHLLRQGALVAVPTETVYGLAGDANNPEAVRRIFALKGRPAEHPLIVHLASTEVAHRWARHWPEEAERLAQAFWPGPMTLILPKAEHVLDVVTGGQDTVGLRVPAHPLLRELLERCQRALAAPSANRFGRVSPTTAAHVLAEFAAEDLAVLDGGSCPVGVESTIIDLSTTRPRILRPGRIRAVEIERVLGRSLSEERADAPRVAGALASHYAPERPCWVLDRQELLARIEAAHAQRRSVGLIHVDPELNGMPGIAATCPIPFQQPEVWEERLYASLRELDHPGIDLILIEAPPRLPGWEAVQDRLQRATAATRGDWP